MLLSVLFPWLAKLQPRPTFAGIALPTMEGASKINKQSGKCPIDFPTGQQNRGYLFSQLCVNILTKYNQHLLMTCITERTLLYMY